MDQLALTSIQAPNQDFIGRLLSQYIGRRLGIPVTYVDDISWQEREQMLDQGRIQAGWICGLPYIWKADRPQPAIELLAAPVMQGARYENRPVYFSDVIVHRDAAYQTFADLRGAIWAFNEPNSHSGYNITRYHLASLGETAGYFGKVIEAGSHQGALEMVLARQIDASAIDSTVLEVELRRRPFILDQIRIIEILGPSPIPPWVVSCHLPPEHRSTIRRVLLQMHQDPSGRQMLDQATISHFAEVTDQDYDPIRRMAEKAARVRW